MKRILSILSVFISLAACSEIKTDYESIPVGPSYDDECLPLVLNFGTSSMTKSIIEDAVLPDGTSVGITVRDEKGLYTGNDYTNIKYSSVLSSGVQIWESSEPVMLGNAAGVVFSYWPYAKGTGDGKTINVTATSDVQTDYMWGLPVAVSKSNRTASITMQHALSAVRIYCNRGSYTGAGQITAIAFGGDCAATAGTLDLTCGALGELSGQGTMIAPAITSKIITSSYQKVSDIIVVPTSSTYGKVVVTLDGTDYPIEFNALDLNPGQITEFYLTANNGELFASDVTVGDWTYGDAEGNEIVVSPKVKITGDLRNIALHNDISDDGRVTINAISTMNGADNIVIYVNPVNLIGNADITQSLESVTGLRTIEITNVHSDIQVEFAGVSSTASANCYVVSKSGRYSFPTVKGNSSESVGDVVSAEVLWETFGTSITPNTGDLIKSTSYANDYITFSTNDIYKEGNAVIAAKDALGNILWSWHIWLTDYPQGQVYYNDAGTMMDRNLGAISAIPGDVGSLGLLYQWGRKDPFLGSSSILTYQEVASTITWPSLVKSDSETGTISYSIRNPMTYINAFSDDWVYGYGNYKNMNRWTNQQKPKSIYDPCPDGWRVPPGGHIGVWQKAVGSSSLSGLPFDNTNRGINFSGKLGDDRIWLPAAGTLFQGDHSSVGEWGEYWSACYADYETVHDDSHTMLFSYAGYAQFSTNDFRTDGKSVRCIKGR